MPFRACPPRGTNGQPRGSARALVAEFSRRLPFADRSSAARKPCQEIHAESNSDANCGSGKCRNTDNPSSKPDARLRDVIEERERWQEVARSQGAGQPVVPLRAESRRDSPRFHTAHHRFRIDSAHSLPEFRADPVRSFPAKLNSPKNGFRIYFSWAQVRWTGLHMGQFRPANGALPKNGV